MTNSIGLMNKHSYSYRHCLKDFFSYYGIEFIVKTKYDE